MTPHRKNDLTGCIAMYHVIGLKQTRGIKNVTLGGSKRKKIGVSRSNGKSSTGALQTTYPRRKSKPTNNR